MLDCNGVSSDYIENSLIYVQLNETLNETESLNMHIGNKVRIATNTILESDSPLTCDNCFAWKCQKSDVFLNFLFL